MAPLRELSLFTGAGGGILASKLLGWTTIAACEIEPAARAMLHARQRDGVLDHFPIWDDICTLDGRPFRGHVDIISGGFPCQGVSIAGTGEGLDDARSGLWGEMGRIVGEVGPRFVFVENSPMLTVRGLDRVTGEFADMGYDCRWGVVGGKSCGLCVDGKRMWIVAHATDSIGWNPASVPITQPDSQGAPGRQFERAIGACASAEAHADRLGDTDRLARDMDRLHAVGNGQIPILAAIAFRLFTLDLSIGGE